MLNILTASKNTPRRRQRRDKQIAKNCFGVVSGLSRQKPTQAGGQGRESFEKNTTAINKWK